MENHSIQGHISFAISLASSFLAWITAQDLDVYFSIGLKGVSIIAGLYAIRSYMASIKYYENKNDDNE